MAREATAREREVHSALDSLHQTTQEVLAEVEGRAGAQAADVASALDLHLTTVIHHLRKLKDRELLNEENGVWHRRGDPPNSDPRFHGAGPRGADVVEAIRERGPMNCSALARTLDNSLSAASQLVDRLEQRGLVVSWREGRERIVVLHQDHRN